MKKILFLYMFLLLIGCNEKRNIEEYSTSNINLPDSSNVKLPIAEEEITWREETVGDILFKISNNFKTNISNKNKKLYINEKDSTALTIDIAQLPEQHKNSILEDLINDTEAFGKIINEDNKKLFNDFKLVSSRRTHLGNIRCIEVIQTSTKVSSSNILMYVVSYFAVSYPYYYSIVFSYPYKANDGNINKIKNSFQLNSKIEKSTDELTSYLNNKSHQIESNINTIKSGGYESKNNTNKLQINLDKRYLGKHLFNAFFIDEFENFGSVEIKRNGNHYLIKGGQRNSRNEYVEIDGVIETESLDEFLFTGTISAYNPTFAKTHNKYRTADDLVSDKCIWTGTAKFEKLFEDRRYWRMRGTSACGNLTGNIDIFFK